MFEYWSTKVKDVVSYAPLSRNTHLKKRACGRPSCSVACTTALLLAFQMTQESPAGAPTRAGLRLDKGRER